MAKVIRFTDLPVLEYQAGDTVAAYRDGQVVRIAIGGGELPDLATVATTGQYSDLLGKPTLGTAASMNAGAFATATQGGHADTAFGWGDHSQAGYALSSSLGSAAGMDASAFATAAQGSKADSAVQPGQLATVATSGAYGDLTGKPTIPAAQVPSDWNATSGVARILNKPTLGSAASMDASAFATAAQGANANTAYGWGNHATAGYALASSLATVATSGSYNDLANKPSIPAPIANTDALNEGATNLYHTAARAVSAIKSDSAWKAAQWDAAYSWGNHAAAGYALSSSLGTAAAMNASAFATAEQGGKADTAYGWGNHAAAGYAMANSLAQVATSGSYNDLDNKPAIPQGTVTSVQVAVPTGLQVSGGPITTSGTLTISYASGYSIPTNTKQGQWDAAYGWGNHASQGYATTAAVQSYAYSRTDVDNLIASATSGGTVWQAATTALPKNTASKVNFSSPRTLTLPASPAENDYVEILRTAGNTTGSIIARNGQTIMGLAENLSLDANIPYLALSFVDGSWRIAS